MSEQTTPVEGPVTRALRSRLVRAFAPERLDIENQSERHRGHAGWNPSGETHFAVTIVSGVFAGMPRLERQRRVHAVLGELLEERIHALSIRAITPAEAKRGRAGDRGRGQPEVP